MSKQGSSWLAILATVDCLQSSSVATSSTIRVMVWHPALYEHPVLPLRYKREGPRFCSGMVEQYVRTRQNATMVLSLKTLPSLLRLGLDDITPKGFPPRGSSPDRPRRDSYAISNKRSYGPRTFRFSNESKSSARIP